MNSSQFPGSRAFPMRSGKPQTRASACSPADFAVRSRCASYIHALRVLEAAVVNFLHGCVQGDRREGERWGTQRETVRKPAPVLAFRVPGTQRERKGTGERTRQKLQPRCKPNARQSTTGARGMR